MRSLSNSEYVVSLENDDNSNVIVTIGGKSSLIRGIIPEVILELNSDDPLSGYLLILNNGSLFEEFLCITLTDGSLRTLDHALLGHMYPSGTFTNFHVVGPGQVSFEYMDGKVWKVIILPAPVFRLPIFGDARGVWRPFNLQKHFALSSSLKHSV